MLNFSKQLAQSNDLFLFIDTMGESSNDDFKSDQSDLEEELENQPGINLTESLFGNIDSNGQLDGDIFDDSAKKCFKLSVFFWSWYHR